jgi:diguanylate cyclase (GGDEF)-like protein
MKDVMPMYEIQNNILSIIIALVLFFSLRTQSSQREKNNRTFVIILWITVAMLIIESVILELSGVNGSLVNIILIIGKMLYLVCVPILSYLAALYLEFELNSSKWVFKRKHIMYVIVFLISIVFIILSIDGHYLFEITSNNIVERGFLSSYFVFIIFVTTLISLFMTIKKNRILDKKDMLALSSFLLPITFAIGMYFISDKTNLILNSFVISLLISYTFTQIKITSKDFLTGLFNKREFEYQLEKIKHNSRKNEKIYGMIIDLDDFKKINDEYGHREGDSALVEAGTIFKSSVRAKDFVSRIGGDEFAIIFPAEDTEVANQIISRIHENLDDFNKNSNYKYDLKISYGYDFYDETKYPSVIDFFNHIDSMMYQQKNNVKTIK